MTIDVDAATKTLELGRRLRLLSEAEVREIRASLESSYPLASAPAAPTCGASASKGTTACSAS